MRYFDTFNAKRPVGIENKGAHIVSGGIAGLAAAVFLIDDGYMDGSEITIYEKLSDMGGRLNLFGGSIRENIEYLKSLNGK